MIVQALRGMTIKDFLKSIPEEFYYWIGIALFYLLSSIFKKREQQVDGAEKKSSENTSLKSFLQNSLQIDTQRDAKNNNQRIPKGNSTRNNRRTFFLIAKLGDAEMSGHAAIHSARSNRLL